MTISLRRAVLVCGLAAIGAVVLVLTDRTGQIDGVDLVLIVGALVVLGIVASSEKVIEAAIGATKYGQLVESIERLIGDHDLAVECVDVVDRAYRDLRAYGVVALDEFREAALLLLTVGVAPGRPLRKALAAVYRGHLLHEVTFEDALIEYASLIARGVGR